MKNILYKSIFIMSIFLFSTTNIINACEIIFEIEQGKKEIYKTGDEIIVKVKVIFTHRVCGLSINHTKFEPNGLNILSATDWVENSPNTWERKIKLKVEGNQSGKLVLAANRTCDLVGGQGSITFNYEPS